MYGVSCAGAHQRVRDEMRKRDLLAAARGFDRAVELFAASVEHVDRHAAKARRGRNREALLHVAGQRRGGASQRRRLRARRTGGGSAGRLGAERRRACSACAATSERRIKPSGPDPRTALEIDVELPRHAGARLIRQGVAARGAVRRHVGQRGAGAGGRRFRRQRREPARPRCCCAVSICARTAADRDRLALARAICVTTPEAVAGTSTSTLSVVTSTRGSPSATNSPTCCATRRSNLR